jgi:hypothetical protein
MHPDPTGVVSLGIGSCGRRIRRLFSLLRSEEVDPLFSKRGGRIAMTLTMRCSRQLVATYGNGFGLFLPVERESALPLIATCCNHGAP